MYAYLLGARRSPELSSLLHLEHAARFLPCFVTRFAAPDDAWGIAREAGGGKSSLPRHTSFFVAPGAQQQGRVQRHRRPWSRANAVLTLKDCGPQHQHRPARGFGIVALCSLRVREVPGSIPGIPLGN